MITKQKKKGKVWVTFTMPAIEDCEGLYLVGDFNEWNETSHPMERADDGAWSLTLELEPGNTHQYRFITNKGVWLNDPDAEASAPNPYGAENSVVST